MNFFKKIKNNIEKRIFLRYLNNLQRNEYNSQNYIAFNERPLEYSFVFKQLATHCPIKILDVGTGITALPHLMRNCGFMVSAIDNVTDYWPEGMMNRHYFVIDDDITNSRLNEKFDLITCISTMEHIIKFEKAMENMSNLLSEHGKLILTFPYNENKYCENVYILPDSRAPKNMPFVTQVFTREHVNDWCKKFNLKLIEQEYWRFFNGEFWSTGERLAVPEKATAVSSHQISCMVLEKTK